MATAKVASYKESIDKWKPMVRGVKFGFTSASIRDELERQTKLLKELEKMEKEFPKLAKQGGRKYIDESKQLQMEVNANRQTLRYLGGVAGLERTFANASQYVEETVLQITSAQEEYGFTSENQIPREQVQSCWDYINRLSVLTHLHSKNAATYHQFHHDKKEIDGFISKHLRKINSQVSSMELEGSLNEVRSIVTIMKNNLSYFLFLWQRIDILTQQSRSIVPLHHRVQPLTQPRPGQVLCNFSGPTMSVKEGEEVLLLDNSDSQMWQVRTIDGREGQIPAIIVWLPPPDLDAVDAVLR